jgi:Fumarylacetoacetase N-terminal
MATLALLYVSSLEKPALAKAGGGNLFAGMTTFIGIARGGGCPGRPTQRMTRRVNWVASANGHAEFPIQNLPFGVFSTLAGGPRGGVAIGDSILVSSADAELQVCAHRSSQPRFVGATIG